MIALNKRLIVILSVATCILIIPLVAMLFTNEVNWTFGDFLVGGALLFGAGLMLEFTLRKLKTKAARIAAGILLFIILALIWAELAVGIFGTPFAGS